MAEAVGRETAGGEIVLSQSNYGKSEIRLVKVKRDVDRHEVWDLDVAVALEGDFEAAHVDGDNSKLLATDTMRNTVYALAKDHLTGSIEGFGLALVDHFLEAGPTVGRVRVRITEAGTNDQLDFLDSTGGARLNLVSLPADLKLGGDYVTSTTDFNATMTQSGTSITVTLGSMIGGSVNTVAIATTMTWVPSAASKDMTNHPSSTALVTESGTDVDF